MPSRHTAAVSIRGLWWRHGPAGGDPWSRGWPPATNRWQRGGAIGAIYLADSPDTAWAEWYRHLAERGIPPLQGMPRELWRWEVDLPRVADLRTTAALRAHAVDAPRPSRTEWPGFQGVGEALHAAGWPALVAPSAARPSGFVLCVFRTSDRPGGVEPVSPAVRHHEPPAPPRGMTT